MRIKHVKIDNFRSYNCETIIEFENLTAFVGKNDIGKSSILEALDIFFHDGKGLIKQDPEDVNKTRMSQGDKEICISVCFDDLPESVIIDESNSTTLEQEYLLNECGQLEVVKKFSGSSTVKVFIRAFHPRNPECSSLLLKKEADLRKILDAKGIECSDRTRNAVMRAAIWNHFSDDLQLGMTEIDVTKSDLKTIWEKLHTYLPMYTLFQADRKNSDGDSEIQDPLKAAVKEILADESLLATLTSVAEEVEKKLTEVSNRTLQKLHEMSPEVASSLTPVIPSARSLKWQDVFKGVSISSDGDIPVNKRGSGVKRLILLNFFRAEAERRMENSNATSIVYAIEEPETSQHTENQRKLISAFLELADAPNTQVILTTHSANVVKELHYENLRLISEDNGSKCVQRVQPGQLPYPSLNEVNYIAFHEETSEYHDELYGHIFELGWLEEFKNGKPRIHYIRVENDGSRKNKQYVLSEYIRHQIHHPENRENRRFTPEELSQSLAMMRDFIVAKGTST